MKKTLHFTSTMRRSNPVKAFLLGIFSLSSSMPRALCENFTRTGFGERYFSFTWCILYTIFLAFVPFLKFLLPFMQEADQSPWMFLFHNITWYTFLTAFAYKSYCHWLDVRRSPSTFDFSKYSLADGTLNKWFKTLKWKGENLDIRLIETIIEPAIFVLIGLILILLGQSVGMLMFFSGVFYSASRFLEYHNGDEHVLDVIDKIIIQQNFEKAFVQGLDPEECSGLSIPTRKPKSKEHRQKVAEIMFKDGADNTPIYVV